MAMRWAWRETSTGTDTLTSSSLRRGTVRTTRARCTCSPVRSAVWASAPAGRAPVGAPTKGWAPAGHDGRCRRRRLRRYRCRCLRLQQYGRQSRYLPWFGLRPARQPHLDGLRRICGDQFGNAVGAAGDVNGDGYTDLIAGAWGFNTPGAADAGRAYVYHGSAAIVADSASWNASGQAAGDEFAGAVAMAGDVNGDGYADVVVGAWGYNSYRGKAYVYHGSGSGLNSSAAWTANGEYENDNFAYSVGAAGDVNGDGYADLVVGAPGAYYTRAKPTSTTVRRRTEQQRRLGRRRGRRRPERSWQRRPLRPFRGHGGECERRRLRRRRRRRLRATTATGARPTSTTVRRWAWMRPIALWRAKTAGTGLVMPWARPVTSTATATPTCSSGRTVPTAIRAGLRLPRFGKRTQSGRRPGRHGRKRRGLVWLRRGHGGGRQRRRLCRHHHWCAATRRLPRQGLRLPREWRAGA